MHVVAPLLRVLPLATVPAAQTETRQAAEKIDENGGKGTEMTPIPADIGIGGAIERTRVSTKGGSTVAGVMENWFVIVVGTAKVTMVEIGVEKKIKSGTWMKIGIFRDPETERNFKIEKGRERGGDPRQPGTTPRISRGEKIQTKEGVTERPEGNLLP